MKATGFQKATRKSVKAKIGITGPSGSGKTYTALELATGIGGTIGLVDTESKSASLYADRFDFLTLDIEPPYTPDKYVRAIEEAEAARIDVLILDSITHEWQGDGGILDQKNKIDMAGRGNSYTNWAKVNPSHEAFVAKLLNAKMHLIATMRSKMAYEQVEKDGKKQIEKLGLAPIQRDGMEYEFTTVFDLTQSHLATISKDRTGMFDGQVFRPSRKHGKQIADYLATGASPPPPSQAASSTGNAGGARGADSIKPMPPTDPEEGEKGITREQWAKITDAMYAAKDVKELAATYKATIRMHENEGTESQMASLLAYKDKLKTFHGGA